MINSDSLDKNLMLVEASLQMEWMTQLTEGVTKKSTIHDQMLQTCLDAIYHQMQTTLNSILQNLNGLEKSLANEQLLHLVTVQKQANKLHRLMDGLRYIVDDPVAK